MDKMPGARFCLPLHQVCAQYKTQHFLGESDGGAQLNARHEWPGLVAVY